jgi:excinuclease ABC subunit C
VELPIAALAKREESIWRPGSSEPLRLDRSDPAHLVLRQARDEAHRFAVSRHRRRRKKRTLSSELLGVPGIGPGRAQALLKRFGSVKGVQDATVDELQRALGPRLGRHVWNHLHAGRSLTAKLDSHPSESRPNSTSSHESRDDSEG